MGEQRKCSVRDGKFVDPCDTLASAVDVGGLSKAKGIGEWAYYVEGKPSRTFYGVRSKDHPNGLLFNVCPWCGERIDAPFAEPDEPPAQVAGEGVAPPRSDMEN